MSESQTATRVSIEFPEGNGDFQIKSVDGLVCYFSKAILAYTSPIFRDMFQVAQQAGITQVQDMVDITETGDQLELFLTHLDPLRQKPTISFYTVEDLLSMAQKYQVSTIIQWFEREITVQQFQGRGDVIQKPMLLNNPSRVLNLAQKFNLQKAGELAVKELLLCDLQQIVDPSNDIDKATIAGIIHIRQKRIKRYQSWIEELIEPRYRSMAYHSYHSHLYQWDEGSVCSDCARTRAKWILNLINAVHASPNWETFKDAFKENFNDTTYCEDCSMNWSEYFKDYAQKWEYVALNDESKLSEWEEIFIKGDLSDHSDVSSSDDY